MTETSNYAKKNSLSLPIHLSIFHYIFRHRKLEEVKAKAAFVDINSLKVYLHELLMES